MSNDVTERMPIEAEERVAYGTEPSQFFDIWRSESSSATLAFIHGGFWRAKYDLGHASFLCAAFAARGFNVANLEYRRVGEPGGGWPGSFQDVCSAIRRVRKATGGRLIVCGHSAGGHLALRAAAEDLDCFGIVALAPVAVLQMAYDLHLSNDAVVEFIGGTPAQAPDAYAAACPSTQALRTRCSIVHGVADDVVPISIAREFHRLKRETELIELRGCGHMELIDPEAAAFANVVAAVEAII